MSDFADLFAVSDAILDGFYGEAFIVSPVVEQAGDVNARRVVGARPDVAFDGIWDDPIASVYAHNQEGHPDSATRRLSPGKHKVDFQLAAIPFAVQRGFVVTRVADGSRYEVGDIVLDGLTRASLMLTATTKAAA